MALDRVRHAAEAAVGEQLRPWLDLVPKAQAVITDIMDQKGDDASDVRLRAARETLDRALGKPQQTVDLQVRKLVVLDV